MNNIIYLLLIGSVFVFGSYDYHGSTTASVVISGGIIKAQNINIEKKYKRKNCPVCKGTGYYISGDKITRVDCGYCEPEKTQSVIVHPPAILKQDCPNGVCPVPSKGPINVR
jgi:hypothetical protein